VADDPAKLTRCLGHVEVPQLASDAVGKGHHLVADADAESRCLLAMIRKESKKCRRIRSLKRRAN
jgi:hypothetical protein